MAEEDKKEIGEVLLYKRTLADLDAKTQLKEQLEETKKETISEKKQLEEECTKKQKVLDELGKKILEGEKRLAESLLGKDNPKGEITLSKRKGEQYTAYLSSNFYEFGKIRNMLEGKERERINKLFPEKADQGADSGNNKKSSNLEKEYIKPQKSTISLTYIKPNREVPRAQNNGKKNPDKNISGSRLIESGKDGLGPEQPGKDSKAVVPHKSIDKYVTTFRIEKDTDFEQVRRRAAEFWGMKFTEVKIIDALKKAVTISSVAKEVDTKQPSFYVFESTSGAGEIMKIEDESEKKEDGGQDEKAGDDFEAQFFKYFYQFRTFFQLENKINKKNDKEGKQEINDYHPTFIGMMLALLIFTIFSVLSFYIYNESTMRAGFANILTKYKGKTIYDVSTLPDLLEYVTYLGSKEFKTRIEKNFKFIGLIAVRQVRTKPKECTTGGARPDKTCYENKYTKDTKFYAPIQFTFNGNPDYLYYYTEEQNRIYSTAKGLFSTYDGSGYISTFDHSSDTYLQKQNDRFAAVKSVYFQDNTRAVIVNFNLNYPVLNVNVTTEILFEISPLGDVVVNPITTRLFVMDYSRNRINLYLIDIVLHILNFVYLFLFVMIIMNQQRDQFMDYCLSKEGILNWGFTLVSLMTLVVFILMMNESKVILDRRSSSEDYLYYYNDFTSYIDYYELYKLLKSTGICILLVRFSFLITKSKRGRMFIVSVKKIGDKFIFVLLINMGVVTAFTVMYQYGVGMYFKEMNTFSKSFLVLTNFTLRNSLFNDLSIFDSFTFFLFMASYLMLISIVGVFLQVLFADAVRNVFIEYEKPVIYSSPLTFADKWEKAKALASTGAKKVWGYLTFWKKKREETA